MSRNGSLTFAWGDGDCTFRLAIGELRELQEKLGASPFTVLERLRLGAPMVDDAREVIRLGLIGGGMKPVEALSAVKFYADNRPLAESLMPAVAILAAALYGVEDEEPGKSSGADPDPESGLTAA